MNDIYPRIRAVLIDWPCGVHCRAKKPQITFLAISNPLLRLQIPNLFIHIRAKTIDLSKSEEPERLWDILNIEGTVMKNRGQDTAHAVLTVTQKDGCGRFEEHPRPMPL